MKRGSNWLIGLIVVLIIANIALVGSLWFKKDGNSPRGDAKEFLVKKLSLNKEQEKTFNDLRREHFQRMRRYQDEMRQLKDGFFNQLSTSNAKPDSLAQEIGALQAKIDLETFDHFSKLRSILNEEQKKEFDNIIQDVIRTMGPRGGPPPGHDRQGPPPPDGPPQ